MAAHVHEQDALGGQGQGQGQDKARAPARLGFDRDVALEFFDDVAPHHVEAHAPPRNVCYLLAGGKSRKKDQALHFSIGEVGQRFFGGQPLFQRFLADGVQRQAAAVVLHFDDDAAAQGIGAQPDGAPPGFARRLALVGRLDAVIDRVAQHVHQRVADALQHLLVQLGLAPWTTRSISLPRSRARSRMARGKVSNTVETGSIRSPSASS